MKGFTLIEILGVLIILGLISLITVPVVANILKENKERLYDIQIKNIEEASRNFVAENIFSLNLNKNEKLGITIKKLKDLGYLDPTLIDPSISEDFSDDTSIIIENKSNDITYTVCVNTACDLSNLTYYGEE